MQNIQLSLHFELREFTESATARGYGIVNEPPPEAVENLKALCVNTLEPLREALGLPIIITSGYRCKALNELITHHSTRSQHRTGEAADFWVQGSKFKVQDQNLVQGSKFKVQDQNLVQGSKFKVQDQNLVQGSKFKVQDQNLVQGSKFKVQDQNLVQGSKFKVQDQNLVQGSKFKVQDQNLVQGSKFKVQDQNLVQGSKFKVQDQNLVQGSKFKVQDQNLVQGSKFKVQGVSPRELLIRAFRTIITDPTVDYDQLIIYPTFIHVSYISRERNRHKLTKGFGNGKYCALSREEALMIC